MFKETHCILSGASTPTATNPHDSQLHAQERHKVSNVGARFLTTHIPDKCCKMIWLLLINQKKKKTCTLRSSSIPGSEQFFSSVTLSGGVAISRLPQRSMTGCPSTIIPWPGKHNSNRSISEVKAKTPQMT